VKLVSNRETRCEDCGGRIPEGTEIEYLPAAGQFKPESRHLVCPEKKKSPTPLHASRAGRQELDRDGLFALMECSRGPVAYDPDVKWVRKHTVSCGQVTAIRKGQPVPSGCPYCGAPWAAWEAA
jgi:hypothetical protein